MQIICYITRYSFNLQAGVFGRFCMTLPQRRQRRLGHRGIGGVGGGGYYGMGGGGGGGELLRSLLWANHSWGMGSHPAPSTHTPAHLPTPEARSLMAWTGFSLHQHAFIRLSLFCLFSTAGQSSICVHSHRTAKLLSDHAMLDTGG